MLTPLLILLTLATSTPNPPGTLLTITANCTGVEATTYLVVMSPIADQVGVVYVCGSYRGDPLPGMRCRLVTPISPGEYITIDGVTLIGGNVLVGQAIVDPAILPP